MNDFFLPQRAFFTVNYRCPFTDPGPKIDGNLREWNSMMLLPNIAGIDGQKPYANCYLCWNNDGVYFGVEVNNKTNYNLSPSDPTKGDCVQLFIDTRDVKTQRANRYCHRFYFLPGGIGKTTKTPFGRQIAINNAQEQSPPCSEDSIKARVRILKKSYQMDYKNSTEALREVSLDIKEGADFVMVKPALPYLDIIKSIKDSFKIPVFAYQVSGEYSMLTNAVKNRSLHKDVIIESLISIKRSGASAIVTYFAIDIAKKIKNNL
mgnify:CR=1 FL=1